MKSGDPKRSSLTCDATTACTSDATVVQHGTILGTARPATNVAMEYTLQSADNSEDRVVVEVRAAPLTVEVAHVGCWVPDAARVGEAPARARTLPRAAVRIQ